MSLKSGSFALYAKKRKASFISWHIYLPPDEFFYACGNMFEPVLRCLVMWPREGRRSRGLEHFLLAWKEGSKGAARCGYRCGWRSNSWKAIHKSSSSSINHMASFGAQKEQNKPCELEIRFSRKQNDEKKPSQCSRVQIKLLQHTCKNRETWNR